MDCTEVRKSAFERSYCAHTADVVRFYQNRRCIHFQYICNFVYKRVVASRYNERAFNFVYAFEKSDPDLCSLFYTLAVLIDEQYCVRLCKARYYSCALVQRSCDKSVADFAKGYSYVLSIF